ncbi:MAG: F0F1 ATP synthase subunit delta [Erysipelotrichales bacterium]|nr:F0F1 ATP synthase subunit delta [Erysipelotrichales bacterium]MBQ1386417.1 F0F1 ATP synthase subunit delta [Erysipelotrichales bacterium]MBQ2309892.1 F0F1 ATP synthase subunit delta [Erysipelotrichales bacterium]MBQ2478992.1 F0F1 ATP synthase subunit delta [Erysipelotrichales bacterium]MBQ4011101.1 F0F1 ATP synthase subunit delta [Erysipelotrichales bacterium]
MDSQVAKRYAEALFSLSREENCVLSRREQLEEIGQTFKDSPDLGKVFCHVKVTKQEKESLIEHVFREYDRETVNFLKLLAAKGRIGYIDRIVKDFCAMCDEYCGIVRGVVYSPYSITDEEKQTLEETIGKKIGKTVRLDLKIDPELIVGVRVEVEGKVFDGSMKNRIERLKASLKEAR